MPYEVVQAETRHFQAMRELCLRVYPFSPPWKEEQLASQHQIFPEGQLVVVDPSNGTLVGMALSLIVYWDDYSIQDSWKDFTDSGYFTNHDPDRGRTLYGAEIMIDPTLRGKGLGKMLYAARRDLCVQKGLLRIRAGARLRGYSRYKDQYSAKQYLYKVIREELADPTLTFQFRQGFKVLELVPSYLGIDPESLGYAAVIEWLNDAQATENDYEKQRIAFRKLFGVDPA